MDQSKKTMRHFYCRDVLWETFEQMANDFDCSIDYLINEAMRYYARSKNYQSAHATGSERSSVPGMPSSPAPGPFAATPSSNPPSSPPSGALRRTGPPPPPAAAAPRAPLPAPTQPDPPPAYASPPSSSGARRAVTPPVAPAAPAALPTLFLVFNSQRIPIEKDQFIIGRGSKTSDLAIKDGNISRKHAAVIRRNGTYYIKDLGSTNGIDYKGMRDRKSTRLKSSHLGISYAVFCLKKKKKQDT